MRDGMSDFAEYCRLCDEKIVWWYQVPEENLVWVVSRDDLDENEMRFFDRYLKKITRAEEVLFRLSAGVD